MWISEELCVFVTASLLELLQMLEHSGVIGVLARFLDLNIKTLRASSVQVIKTRLPERSPIVAPDCGAEGRQFPHPLVLNAELSDPT